MNTGIETKNEHVLIVGGSSGMGLALARILLSEGARVTIAGRSEAAKSFRGKRKRFGRRGRD